MKNTILIGLISLIIGFFVGKNVNNTPVNDIELSYSLHPEIQRFFSEPTIGTLDIELDPIYGSTVIDAEPLYSLPEKPDSDLPTGNIQGIKPFDRTLNQSDLFTIRDYMEKSMDIDGDDEMEKVAYFSTGVGSVPQMLQIVKNDQVVFEMEGSSLEAVETYGNKPGFILTTQIWQDKNGFRVRYVVDEDGTIKPLWQQRHAGIKIY